MITNPVHSYQLFTLTESKPMFEIKQMLSILCSFAHSKRLCGKILRIFTQYNRTNDAAAIIFDVMCFDFFPDLNGKMDSFYDQFPEELNSQLQSYMKSSKRGHSANGVEFTDDGEIIDSDVDEAGNLK
jgi:hypothetical protein